ncbi:hypothetical protein [Streptomyces sp. NPDC002159]
MLTPEEARVAGERLQHILSLLRQLREQLRLAARSVPEALRAVTAFAERVRAARAACPGRPAWASPYGPAPRRH